MSTTTSNSDDSPRYTNALVNETSPYLLQHAHNPVDWNPWNDATLEKAKSSRKLMIVSIGYAACHWCHVMEHESFEDTLVAAVMNKNFINVKVDREERPDIDQVYINAVQLMTGSAGWPLNVITLPDGRPVWGGTYFKKEDWIQALERIQEIYTTNPERLEDYAGKLEEGIRSIDLIELNNDKNAIAQFDVKAIITDSLSHGFDKIYGGYKRAPKFMMPNNLEFLLRAGHQLQDSTLIDHVTLTLDKMAYGGLYDAIGGGFSRYSVDEKWHVPHFEKMLYDNAQLVSLYSRAYLATKRPLYKKVVEETLSYIEEEMSIKNGAFYSSLDADSLDEKNELEEGAYYVYKEDELRTVLGEDFQLFSKYYNINEFGRWENDTYVLIRTQSDEEFIRSQNFTASEFDQKKHKWRQKLSEFRNKRPKPRLDDKSITSWNALMLKGYVDAYKAFQNPEYLEKALKNANFIVKNQLSEDYSLRHSFKDGVSTITGFLEDYATVIDAFLALYEVTVDNKWLNLSNTLTAYTFDHFYDSNKSMFYFTSNESANLVARTTEYRDNVISSSNSIMANNLYKLSHYFDIPKYKEVNEQMLKNVLPEAKRYPSSFSNWLQLLLNYQYPYYEIVVAGDNAKDKLKEIHQNYIPNSLTAATTGESEDYLLKGRYIEGDALIYVCVNNACRLPENETQKALKHIK